MIILGIDPGTERSGLVWLDGDHVAESGVWDNDYVLEILAHGSGYDGIETEPGVLAVEQVESFGMPVGRDVFETVWWSGRFAQAWWIATGEEALRIPRKEVKLHLCGSLRAKDANVRRALLDLPRWKRGKGSEPAAGTKRSPGGLYGISGHSWAALAVAVAAEARLEALADA